MAKTCGKGEFAGAPGRCGSRMVLIFSLIRRHGRWHGSTRPRYARDRTRPEAGRE